MKTKKLLLGLFVLIMVLNIQAVAQNKMVSLPVTGIATGEATAHIVVPIELTKNSDLLFGNVAAGPSAGTVTIAVDGMRTGNGGITLIAAGNNSGAASFAVTGYPEATYTIDLPVSITIEDNGNVMVVDNFVSDLGSVSQLSSMGEGFMVVGATLNVEANQAPGLYTGTFDVIVAYN